MFSSCHAEIMDQEHVAWIWETLHVYVLGWLGRGFVGEAEESRDGSLVKEFTRQMCHETRSRDVASRACFYLFWFSPFLLVLYLRARHNLQYCTDHIVGYIIVVVLYLQPQFLSHKQLRYAIVILVNILYLHLYIVSVYRYIPNLSVLVSQATEFPCIEDSNRLWALLTALETRHY